MKRTEWWLEQVGRCLLPGVLFAARIDRPDPSHLEDLPEPEIPWTGLRFCKDCNTGTLHREFWWAIEQETTIECEGCGNVWVG